MIDFSMTLNSHRKYIEVAAQLERYERKMQKRREVLERVQNTGIVLEFFEEETGEWVTNPNSDIPFDLVWPSPYYRVQSISDEKFYDIFNEDLTIKFAETGEDREMDFDLEKSLDREYQIFLTDMCGQK